MLVEGLSYSSRAGDLKVSLMFHTSCTMDMDIHIQNG